MLPQVLTVIDVPFSRTVPDSVAPKLVPVIVTIVPAAPVVGEMLVITGFALTVNDEPLLVSPLVVTTTFPDVAVAGMVATIEVLETLETCAAIPLKVTVESAPKLLPLTVTLPPGGPVLG